MKKQLVLLVALAPAVISASAQQTGTIIRISPGSSLRNSPKAIMAPSPKPTCDTPATPTETEALPTLPDMLFSRDNLSCVRHSDGRTEKLMDNLPWGSHSATNSHIAYWEQDKHELHVYSLVDHNDRLIDRLPGAMVRDIVWSSTGQVLAYLPHGASPAGIRVMEMDTGRQNIFAGSFSGLVASPDPAYIVALGSEGIERFWIRDGRRDVIVPAKYASRAVYSRSGALLGILADTTSKFLNSPPDAAFSSGRTADDDEPDCRGGSSHLIVQVSPARKLIDIPVPEGFDTVWDFEFSPDDRNLAVTFGVTGCDYPGDAAGVYRVSLPDLKVTPASAAGRLSVEAHWSPDGRFIVYQDYTGSDSPLMSVEWETGAIARLTNPGQHGPDYWLSWR